MGICTSTHTRVRSAPADSRPSRRPLLVEVQPQNTENRDSPPSDSTWTPRDVTLSIGSSSASSKVRLNVYNYYILSNHIFYFLLKGLFIRTVYCKNTNLLTKNCKQTNKTLQFVYAKMNTFTV